MSKAHWEQEFEDWERLVKVAGAHVLLDDPKAIWDEAWRVATLLCCQKINQGKDSVTIQKEMVPQ